MEELTDPAPVGLDISTGTRKEGGGEGGVMPATPPVRALCVISEKTPNIVTGLALASLSHPAADKETLKRKRQQDDLCGHFFALTNSSSAT